MKNFYKNNTRRKKKTIFPFETIIIDFEKKIFKRNNNKIRRFCCFEYMK